MDCEATFGIVHKAEVLARLLYGDNVHEACWVGWVGAYFAVDFDEALHDDGFGLAGVEGVFEATRSCSLALTAFRNALGGDHAAIPIPNEDDQGHAIPQFVRTRAGLRRVGTAQLVEQPVRWRRQPLLMLSWSSLTHLCGVVVEVSAGVGFKL